MSNSEFLPRTLYSHEKLPSSLSHRIVTLDENGKEQVHYDRGRVLGIVYEDPRFGNSVFSIDETICKLQVTSEKECSITQKLPGNHIKYFSGPLNVISFLVEGDFGEEIPLQIENNALVAVIKNSPYSSAKTSKHQ